MNGSIVSAGPILRAARKEPTPKQAKQKQVKYCESCGRANLSVALTGAIRM